MTLIHPKELMLNNTIKFHPDHMDMMTLPIEIEEQIKSDYLFASKLYYASLELGAAKTMKIDNRLIASFGYCHIKKGVFEVWQVPSIYIVNHLNSLVRVLRSYIKYVAEYKGYNRCQTVGRKELGNWFKLLGFQEEGILRSYGDNKEDYIQYGRIF
jgi:hypothetical protein